MDINSERQLLMDYSEFKTYIAEEIWPDKVTHLYNLFLTFSTIISSLTNSRAFVISFLYFAVSIRRLK